MRVNVKPFEMLMENWGLPFDKVNFLEFSGIQFLQICRECANALNLLHRRFIFHGDIKLPNIILNLESFIPKFIDFGISSQLQNIEDLLEDKIMSNRREMGCFKGFTKHMAPNELLQYLQNDNSVEIFNYCLSKMDIFYLGMTFFIMVTRCPYYIQKDLKDKRSSKLTEKEFSADIDKIMNSEECLGKLILIWGNEFSLKIITIIKSCLQTNYQIRPNSLQLYAVFQYFNEISLSELEIILSSLNDSENIKGFIKANKLEAEIKKLYFFESEYEKSLKLCEEYENIIKWVFVEKYKNTREYVNFCYLIANVLSLQGIFLQSIEWFKKGLDLARKLFTHLAMCTQIPSWHRIR